MSSITSVKANIAHLDNTSTFELDPKTDSNDQLSTTDHVIPEFDLHDEEGYIKILADSPINIFSRQRCQIYATCFIVYLCSTMNGFDGSLMNSINTLDEYVHYFKLSGSATGTGLVFSIYQVGQICATLFIWLADYIGRVKTIFLGCIIVVIGAIVSATATSIHVFIGARFILSFGCGLATATAPLYLVEITPCEHRSTLSALYNTLYYIGSIIATWSIYGTSINFAGSSSTFKIPLWLQLLCPGFVVLTILFIAPESPRYMYSKNQRDKARDFFIKYQANGDSSHPIVEYQLAQMDLSYKEVPKMTLKDYFNFPKLFTTKSRSYRSGLVIAMSWFGQFSGNAVVTYYMTTIFLDLGITSSTTRLLLNAINSIICYIFATAGSLFINRLGRRVILLYATSGFVICFAVIAGCIAAYENNGNQVAARAGIAFVYIFGAVFFAFGYTPLQTLYPAEVLSSEMRARGMALFQLTQGVASFVNTFAAPVAMQNIKYWFYVFFVFWDIVELIVIYFFFVETKNLTLEEIELLFEASNPVAMSIEVSHKRSGEIRSRKVESKEKENGTNV